MSPVGPALTSIHNTHVKFARSLGSRKARYRQRAFVVEGVRLINDALDAGFRPSRVFFDPERLSEPMARRLASLATGETVVHEVAPSIIEIIADTETPQGIAAIFRFPEIPIIHEAEAALYVVADGIKDPGNLGTLFRSASAAGAHALFVTRRTVDPFAPKVVRAAMGAHFRLPVRSLDWDVLDPAIETCVQRLGAEAGQGVPYDAVDWRLPSLLVLGSEASGISDRGNDHLTGTVSIPMRRGVESLNAAVAGAVILFEAARQRRGQ